MSRTRALLRRYDLRRQQGRDRSSLPQEPGLTLAASPRSTNHTSPRWVAGIGGFSAVKLEKEGFRAHYEILI
jgi:hypothetical protein